jgi:hypothetical protein
MLDFTTGNLMIKRQKLVSTCWLVRKLRTRKTRFPGSSSPPRRVGFRGSRNRRDSLIGAAMTGITQAPAVGFS